SRTKRIDSLLTAVGDRYGMSVLLERLAQGFAHDRVVVDEQDAQPLRGHRYLEAATDRRRACPRCGGAQLDRGPATRLALDLQRAAVPLHHPVHHGQSQPGAALALRGEEWLEAPVARRLIHTDTGIDDLNTYLVGAQRARAHRDESALGHRIDSIQNQ